MVITHTIQVQIRSPSKTWLSWCRPATFSASLAIKNVPSFVRHFAPARPTPHHPIHHSLARFTPSCLLQSSVNFARSFACSITPNYPNPEFEPTVCIESRNPLFGPPLRQANRYLHRGRDVDPSNLHLPLPAQANSNGEDRPTTWKFGIACACN
jgi:hypothetical protein